MLLASWLLEVLCGSVTVAFRVTVLAGADGGVSAKRKTRHRFDETAMSFFSWLAVAAWLFTASHEPRGPNSFPEPPFGFVQLALLVAQLRNNGRQYTEQKHISFVACVLNNRKPRTAAPLGAP